MTPANVLATVRPKKTPPPELQVRSEHKVRYATKSEPRPSGAKPLISNILPSVVTYTTIAGVLEVSGTLCESGRPTQMRIVWL